MTDFSFDVDVLRSKMASALADNPEQMAWVLVEAICDVDFDDLSEFSDNHEGDPEEAANRLRAFADLIDPNGGG